MQRFHALDRLPGEKSVLFDHPEHGPYWIRAGVVMSGKRCTERYNPDYFDKWASIPQDQIDHVSKVRHYLIHDFVKEPWHHVLDFGCGTGDFVEYASRRYMADACKTFHGYDIKRNDFNKALAQTFHTRKPVFIRKWDVVTFWDSLEHMEDPISVLEQLNTRYVIVSVPNAHPTLFDLSESFFAWRHCRPTEHIWHFNYESIQPFFAVAGYKMIVSNYVEDDYRPAQEGQPFPNILSAVFEKEQHSA
tara:strand:- start:2122 stop:2862 length:741 start_codon:yes stop_codon:yes gene_type:complete